MWLRPLNELTVVKVFQCGVLRLLKMLTGKNMAQAQHNK
ncbi:hypothetical protein O59_000071 [Cellvibrio sp. BR]|nr:hypothetical protein O59_000071 [Cellvibrio sp. BR]